MQSLNKSGSSQEVTASPAGQYKGDAPLRNAARTRKEPSNIRLWIGLAHQVRLRFVGAAFVQRKAHLLLAMGLRAASTSGPAAMPIIGWFQTAKCLLHTLRHTGYQSIKRNMGMQIRTDSLL
jgi:hypothetical protein